MASSKRNVLEIDAPTAYCGNCRFQNSLAGEWDVDSDGRFVWRSSADPLLGRGPSLDWCGECGAELTTITVEQSPAHHEWRMEPLSDEARQALLDSAKKAQEEEL